MGTAFLIFILFTVCMFSAAYNDARSMTIPNWVSAALLISFLAVTPFVWQGWSIFGTHMLVGLAVFAFTFALFAVGGLGAGDAKLMAATAFWWQWPDLVYFFAYTVLAGGIIAVFMLVGRKFLPAKVATSPVIHNLFRHEGNMPYGLAIAFGALATLPQSQIFQAAAGIN